jgi:Protein kinase domain
MDRVTLSSILKALRLAEYGSNLNSAGAEIEPLCAALENASAYISQLNATHAQPHASLTDEVRRIELALDRVQTMAKQRARRVLQTDTELVGMDMELSSTKEKWRKIPHREHRSRMRALLAMKHIGNGNAITSAQVNARASRPYDRTATIPCHETRNTNSGLLKIGDETFYASSSPLVPQDSPSSFNVRPSRLESRSAIAGYITVPSEPERDGRSKAGNPELDTSRQRLLEAEGLLFTPSNWPGKGQHVEFAHENEVPLVVGKMIGWSKSALVHSVTCRGVRLARKSIPFSRQEHQTEARLLNKLHHPHIVQLVGTYTLHETFAILLYPVAEYTLDIYMKRCYSGEDESKLMLSTLEKFPRCLVTAMNYIHSSNIVHMDIKPQNVLVRKLRNPAEKYRVYIADFGISYSYADTLDTETDRPTPFTQRYCAPEVASQKRRGKSADTYSLGCVFAEIFTVLAQKTLEDFTEARKDRALDDTTFRKNRDRVLEWVKSLNWSHYQSKMQNYQTNVPLLITGMIQDEPGARVGPEVIEEHLSVLGITAHACCSELPEPYERVEDALVDGN